MKKAFLILITLLTIPVLHAQEECNKTFEESLIEISSILNEEKAIDLWDRQLNADIIFISPSENKMYITSIHNGKNEQINVKEWNNSIGLANTSTVYDGKKYVTIYYDDFVRMDCQSRAQLLIHEIFHYHQEELGFPMVSSNNMHLDTPIGRALLHIEFNALLKALKAEAEALSDAIYIRKYRQNLFPSNNEDLFELNEGLAEYTGIELGIKNRLSTILKALTYNINRGYTNTFAYCSGAAYGYLLNSLYPEWQRDCDLKKGIPYLFNKIERLDININELNEEYTQSLLRKYKYEDYLKEESNLYENPLEFNYLLETDTPKVLLSNDGINILFDPNDRIISLGDKAVLLRNITLRAKWGEVKVKSGIIRMNDWSAFLLLPPTEVNDTEIKGKDYIINLNPDWQIIKKDNTWQIEQKK